MPDVTYTDTPNNPLIPLAAGPLEPIGFTCLRALDWLMVDMGQGFEECAFREGAFRGPYAAHSSISGDLLTGTIYREGGWLAPPKLIPQVVPVPVVIPPTGQTLAPIYEVDFTALASQTITTVGAYTIGGLVWWLKGQFTGLPFGSVNNAALISGTGLRISGDYGTLTGGAVDDPFLRWFLPGTNIPNFNPLAPTVVRARMVCSNPSDSGGYIGLIDTTSDGVKVKAAQRSSELYAGPGRPGSMRYKFGTNNPTDAATRVAIASQGVAFVGVYQMFRKYGDVGAQLWSGSIPTIDDFAPQGQGLQPFGLPLRTNPGVVFSMECNGGSTKTIDLTHLSIYQPRVAA